ncbi:MAG: glycosyltransferase family 2 protein [bacterium]|nr:glycosyltransferase family 2 protein [bacterium]
MIIVNWNAGVQIRECVESVLENDPGCIEQIIVIDNASIDGSADVIEKLPKVDVIRAGKNLGFAAACNLGASKGSAPYILFLNPDTRVGANSFLVPHTFMEQVGNDRVGICGIQLVDEQGQVSRTCARFPTLTRLVLQALGVNKISGFRHTGVHITEWDHKRSARVDHVIGAFFLIRRPLFETLGGFDEQFFVYLEDIDLSYRAYNQGYISMYLTEAQAFHAGGGTSSQVKDIRLFYSLRSRLLYGFKHFPIWQAWLLTGVTMVLEPCSRLLYCVIRRDWDGIKHTIQGYRMLWRNLPQVLFGFKPRCG